MIFLLGFLLGMAGLALLIAGEFPWPGGKKVPARTARQMGTVFVSFFPVVLLTRFAIYKFDPDQVVNVNIVYWSIFVLWLSAGLFLFGRAVMAQGTRHRLPPDSPGPTLNPFAVIEPAADPGPARTRDIPVEAPSPSVEAPPWAPSPTAPPTKKTRPAHPRKNPFDFG